VTLAVVVLIAGVTSFLSGSIPVGLLVGNRKGVDVRKIGSGHIGAMKVAPALGTRWFGVVFPLDLR